MFAVHPLSGPKGCYPIQYGRISHYLGAVQEKASSEEGAKMSRPRVCLRPLASLRPLDPLKPLALIQSTKRRPLKRYRSCRAILEGAEKLQRAGADKDGLAQFYLQLMKKQPKLMMKLAVRVLRLEVKEEERAMLRRWRNEIKNGRKSQNET